MELEPLCSPSEPAGEMLTLTRNEVEGKGEDQWARQITM
jgi:hypothetical protein